MIRKQVYQKFQEQGIQTLAAELAANNPQTSSYVLDYTSMLLLMGFKPQGVDAILNAIILISYTSMIENRQNLLKQLEKPSEN